MKPIYLNDEAMRRAEGNEDRVWGLFLTHLALFILGIACGYAWFFHQG